MCSSADQKPLAMRPRLHENSAKRVFNPLIINIGFSHLSLVSTNTVSSTHALIYRNCFGIRLYHLVAEKIPKTLSLTDLENVLSSLSMKGAPPAIQMAPLRTGNSRSLLQIMNCEVIFANQCRNWAWNSRK